VSDRYPTEALDPDEDDGTMPENVAALTDAVVGRRIVSAERETIQRETGYGRTYTETPFVITLDDGRRVIMRDTDDCCASTELEQFLLNPEAVDHMILGVGTTGGYTTWHIYADFGDVMQLKVGWSCGNPFYYGYGFDIQVEDVPPTPEQARIAELEQELSDANAKYDTLKNGMAQQTGLWDMLRMVHRELDLWFNDAAGDTKTTYQVRP
jgi:hypothetical protein